MTLKNNHRPTNPQHVEVQEVEKKVYRLRKCKHPKHRIDLGLPNRKVLEQYVKNGYNIEPEYDTESLSGHIVRYWASKPYLKH